MEKLANKLEKWQAQFEALEAKFTDSGRKTEFDSMKADIISLLEEMQQLVHAEAEEEEPEPEEEESEE